MSKEKQKIKSLKAHIELYTQIARLRRYEVLIVHRE